MSERQAVNINTVVMLAAVAGGIYLVSKIWGTAAKAAGAVAGAIGTGYTKTVDAVSSGLYAMFGPADQQGANTWYTVTFPDHSRHSIPADYVTTDGLFTWPGDWPGAPASSDPPVTLQLVKDNQGKWFATLNA